MDAFHPYGRVGRLRAKPLEKFDRTDHFLRAVTAEREGLLTVKVRTGRLLPSETASGTETGSSANMYSCATSALATSGILCCVEQFAARCVRNSVTCAPALPQLGWEEAELVEKAMRKLSDYYKSDSVSIVSQVTWTCCWRLQCQHSVHVCQWHMHSDQIADPLHQTAHCRHTMDHDMCIGLCARHPSTAAPRRRGMRSGSWCWRRR